MPRLLTGYGGTDNMFSFFHKIIIFIVNKEKDYIRSSYCKFSQLGGNQTTLLTSFSCFIGLWKHTCWSINTHVLSKLFYKVSWKKLKSTYAIPISPFSLLRRKKNFIKEIKLGKVRENFRADNLLSNSPERLPRFFLN